MSTNSSALGASGFGGILSEYLRNAGDKLQAYLAWKKRYTSTYHELTQLSDRDLADLGMTRHNISQIARDAANEAAGLS